MKRFTIIFIFFLGGIFSALAQNYSVQGTVTGTDGIPLLGVNVLVKNASIGTTTDFDGNYNIEVSADDILTFSYVGFLTKEFTITSAQTLDVTLELDQNNLDEVVVIGYGTQKKSVVTGAISSIKASDLESLPLTRVEESLQGRASGLTIAANSGQPGSSSTIRVRGITSFGNNEPLWVVDGVIVDSGGIGYLNQSDIESIEVLKDAASQAIYGARAAAGVILVTTKTGKSGKLVVNYNGYSGFSGAAKKLDLLNATEYAAISNEKYANDYSGSAGDFSLPFPNLSSLGAGTDWQDIIFNDNAKRENHEISLSGGNETSTFYLSFGLLDQEGIVTSDISHYTRKNIRINSTHKINPVITVGETIGYSNEKSTGLGNTNSEYGGPLSSAINLDPITQAVITDPAVAKAAPYSTNEGIIRDENGNPYGISSLVLQEMSNPLAYIQTRLGNYGWSDNFVGNVYVNLELIPGLNLKSTLGGKLAYWGNESFTPVSYLNSSTVTSQNNISRGTNKGFGWNIENTISYAKQLNNHSFSVLLGQGTYIDNITKGETVTYNNIPVTSREDAAFFAVPDDQIIANAYIGTEHRVTSLFSRLTYNYGEKYLFTGIIRRDGSSRFGSNNKFGWFPSFSLGWVPSKENFWKENDIVNQLKFRGGYGVVGSDAIGDFKYLSTIGDGRNYTFGNVAAVVIGNSPNAPANPDLRWEETTQTNIGFDTRLFDNLTLSFDYYNKKTEGILQDLRLPGYVGTTGNPAANIADMVNRGFDFELGYNKQINDFNISANGNFSYLENEVTYLGEDIDFLSGGETIQSGNYPITRTAVGESFNSFYGFKTNGIFQNQEDINNYVNSEGQVIQPNAVPGDFRWEDIDDNGRIDDKDRKFLGSSIPKYTFGLTLNLAYKNFDFLAFAQGAAGNKIFQGLRRLDITNANYQTEALQRWTGEGTSNNFPRLSNIDSNNNFSNPSDFYLEKGDYVRLKTVQIGYSFPLDIIQQVRLTKLRIYLTGENLVTLTGYTGFDPEIGGGVFGIDRGFYPQAISGLLGVNLQF
ncbi:TonB-linked SusC/RagA family outer membrane protein [Gillisia sp. Hel_I_86]|uniref:SusC/RagA family TonB-linked outer membrane protein n=1 Tax=Gillisia sp. Hel_I_86 TaxID=1249981 RepID=UPI001199B4FE|nr:TonB-dependent receptor [Gillisia sp. Hel_I_86]TVZ26139.1 TonB-linked SusC/RagA family outer membrane protein [Gillisia sp. Hel_I_86]